MTPAGRLQGSERMAAGGYVYVCRMIADFMPNGEKEKGVSCETPLFICAPSRT